ncbi:diacylglycerol kinase family protein [Streptomyces indicus]|uniref:Diacylglycerol kinase catalytic domain-containing protein n=1 Tax=Streptomyces indicus TaxID=417292 RepID=A0A1G9CEU5_9ACTN|nr:diacylglycerol kinase family protein [Streptomyces indicus]SDK50157.1 Diacylglycerol kinase catalytic domain-containing protein [Streptomyces indicus]
MSAPAPAAKSSQPLLVVIDPAARRTDGESVRIAKDVLCARSGGPVKICLPDGPEEFARALRRRGTRRPVVVGDDRALLRAVSLLHRERELASSVLSVVPVGTRTCLAQGLGVPDGPVAAASAVLDGEARRLDLLVDDSDGVVLGDLRIPALPAAEGAGRAPWWGPGLRTCQSLVRTLVRPAPAQSPGPSRLRVEADGVTLVDLDQPVADVSVSTARGGFARVEVRPTSVGAAAPALHARARTVTVSGPDFRYRADALTAGPVRTRTWTVRAGAWALTLPRG